MDERKSVEGTNAARDKPMVSDLSAQLTMPRGKMALVLLSASLAHAAWQDDGDVLLLSAPLTQQPRRVQPP